jgi:hypothetical protein
VIVNRPLDYLSTCLANNVSFVFCQALPVPEQFAFVYNTGLTELANLNYSIRNKVFRTGRSAIAHPFHHQPLFFNFRSSKLKLNCYRRLSNA